MVTGRATLASRVEEALLERNQLCEAFFAREARRLSVACQEMSDRFLRSICRFSSMRGLTRFCGLKIS